MQTFSYPHRPTQSTGLFFQTPEQRAQLARERFFDESERPTGLVSEAVIQSWGRSSALGHVKEKRPALDPVRPNAFHGVLQRNRVLLQAAAGELQQLESSLTGTGCRVLLTNAAGIIVHATGTGPLAEQTTLNVACRVGVNLSEDHIGTTAPGIVVRTGMASTVAAHEHFYEQLGGIHCAAAPIRDMYDRLAGVLDLSTEARPFGFDATAVVGIFATAIENRLLMAQAQDHAVLTFQTVPSLLNTPMQAMACINGEGQVVWLNGVASQLLARPRQGQAACEEVFGLGLGDLLDLACGAHPGVLRLPSGLGIWVQARVQWRDGLAHGRTFSMPTLPQLPASAQSAPETPEPLPHPGAEAAAPSVELPCSLADTQRRLIVDTLERNKGNVVRTAKELGVSRGLIYRHLRKDSGSEA